MEHGDLYRQLVGSLNDAVMVLEFDGTFRMANASADTLVGTPLQGRRIQEFLDESGREHATAHLARCALGEFREAEVDSLFIRADGSPLWVRLRETGLRDEGGEGYAGIILRVTDNHETKALLDELHDSRESLQRAERISSSGSWTWNIGADTTTHSPGLAELYGDHLDALLSRDWEVLRTIVHTQDQDRFRQALVDLLGGVTTSLDVELRQLGRHGWMWVRLRAVGTHDEHGVIRELTGTYQDVSRLRRTEDDLRDLISFNALMQAVASAANEATSLDAVLAMVGGLIAQHEGWYRTRAFLPSDDGVLVPHLTGLGRGVAPEPNDPAIAASELATAIAARDAGVPAWEPEHRRTIAFPVALEGDLLVVVVLTSRGPVHRPDLVEAMVSHGTLQLARVAERERAAREVAEARDRALDASQHKSDFLATVSHEIRTPLNGIIGLNELLGFTALTDHQQHLVDGVAVSSRSLLELINDVLDFSKIEAGHLDVESIDFEPRSVLDDVGQVLAGAARTKGVALDVVSGSGVPAVASGDPVRLKQVLLNLGSNALKFTGRGSVAISATGTTPDEDGVVVLRIEVRDTGPGISTERQQSIFAPFTQADTSTTRHFGGTGLGLAICTEIVRAFGGHLGVESAPGHGSTFWFTMPVGPPLGRADHVTSVTHPARFVPTSSRRPRVLVVEDHPVNQVVARGFLERLGYDVDVAGDGVEALAMLAHPTYDAVLMDLQMPRLDGYDATRALREAGATTVDGARLPVIAMTATAVSGERERCLDAGMDDFLTKPVSAAVLDATLVRWVGSRPAPASASPVPATGAPSGPSHAAPASPYLDLSRLDDLRDLDPGNTAYLDRAIGNFHARRTSTAADLADAARSEDAEALTAVAHALLGSAGNLGLPVVAELAASLEDIGRSGSTDGAGPLITWVTEALERSAQAIDAYQAWYRAAGTAQDG